MASKSGVTLDPELTAILGEIAPGQLATVAAQLERWAQLLRHLASPNCRVRDGPPRITTQQPPIQLCYARLSRARVP